MKVPLLILGPESVPHPTRSWHRPASHALPPRQPQRAAPRPAPLALTSQPPPSQALASPAVRVVGSTGCSCCPPRGLCGTPSRTVPASGQVSHPFPLPLLLLWTCPRHCPWGQRPARDILSRSQQDRDIAHPTPSRSWCGGRDSRLQGWRAVEGFLGGARVGGGTREAQNIRAEGTFSEVGNL